MRNKNFRRLVTATVTLAATAALGVGISSEAWGKSTEWGKPSAQVGQTTVSMAQISARSTEWG